MERIRLVKMDAETGLINAGAKKPEDLFSFALENCTEPELVADMEKTAENVKTAYSWIAGVKNSCAEKSGTAGRYYEITAYAIEYYIADADGDFIDGSDYVPAEDEV